MICLRCMSVMKLRDTDFYMSVNENEAVCGNLYMCSKCNNIVLSDYGEPFKIDYKKVVSLKRILKEGHYESIRKEDDGNKETAEA